MEKNARFSSEEKNHARVRRKVLSARCIIHASFRWKGKHTQERKEKERRKKKKVGREKKGKKPFLSFFRFFRERAFFFLSLFLLSFLSSLPISFFLPVSFFSLSLLSSHLPLFPGSRVKSWFQGWETLHSEPRFRSSESEDSDRGEENSSIQEE